MTECEQELLMKISIYEQFLHRLQLYAEVVMNPKAVQALISNACTWSYAHRCGNGMLSEEEQDAIIKRAFDKLLDIPETSDGPTA